MEHLKTAGNRSGCFKIAISMTQNARLHTVRGGHTRDHLIHHRQRCDCVDCVRPRQKGGISDGIRVPRQTGHLGLVFAVSGTEGASRRRQFGASETEGASRNRMGYAEDTRAQTRSFAILRGVRDRQRRTSSLPGPEINHNNLERLGRSCQKTDASSREGKYC